MKKSISIIVPAYNEEANLERAVKKYNLLAKELFDDHEIIIFNDCSTDQTGRIADSLAKKNPRIRVIHNKTNMGLGYNFRKGVELAKKTYFTVMFGEGDMLTSSARNILKSAGKADIIMSYVQNPEARTWIRRIISSSFTKTLNLLFGLKLKYYNGYTVHKTKLIKKTHLTTNSFAYQAEALIRLLKKGHSYLQVPFLTAKTSGSSMFRLKNLVGIGKTVLRLFWEVRIKREV